MAYLHEMHNRKTNLDYILYKTKKPSTNTKNLKKIHKHKKNQKCIILNTLNPKYKK
jgi:hypothetical protein